MCAALANTDLDMLRYDLDEGAHASYCQKSIGLLHYLHGVNPFNMGHLINIIEYGAESSANQVWHDWFRDSSVWDDALTSEQSPALGYLLGGPNAVYSGQASPPLGEPAQKAYRD